MLGLPPQTCLTANRPARLTNVLTHGFTGFLRRRRALKHFARHRLVDTLAGRPHCARARASRPRLAARRMRRAGGGDRPASGLTKTAERARSVSYRFNGRSFRVPTNRSSPHSHVRVSQGSNVAHVRFRVGPWIHDGVRAGQRRVLMIPLRAVVPLPPEPIEVGMVQPEDRIGW